MAVGEVAARDVMLRLRGLRVSYRVYRDRNPKLRKALVRPGSRREYIRINAVRGVDLDVHSGEVLGLIGPNGSGKSTLLKAMTGLQTPESGAVLARSQPVLLGVSAMLKPELTGRRNIMVGGLALGLRRQEVKRIEDSIIDFSGLGDAIDRPLRSYSSGMRARLHFSIATAIVPPILLIDEALSVGDSEFKARSAARLSELREKASAVVIVSHSLKEIEQICTRVGLVRSGRIASLGDPADVVGIYETEAGSNG